MHCNSLNCTEKRNDVIFYSGFIAVVVTGIIVIMQTALLRWLHVYISICESRIL